MEHQGLCIRPWCINITDDTKMGYNYRYMMDQLNQIDCARLISELDDGLTLVDTFKRRVCKVRRDGKDYILKFGAMYRREAEILRAADGVEGMTHLVKDYGLLDYRDGISEAFGILKEYAPGSILTEATILPGIEDILCQMDRTVEELHDRGIANLDLHEENVVLSDDGERLTLIDLDTAHFRAGPDEAFAYLFDMQVKQDLYHLSQLKEYLLYEAETARLRQGGQ